MAITNRHVSTVQAVDILGVRLVTEVYDGKIRAKFSKTDKFNLIPKTEEIITEGPRNDNDFERLSQDRVRRV